MLETGRVLGASPYTVSGMPPAASAGHGSAGKAAPEQGRPAMLRMNLMKFSSKPENSLATLKTVECPVVRGFIPTGCEAVATHCMR
jgi:hypothetical protein